MKNRESRDNADLTRSELRLDDFHETKGRNENVEIKLRERLDIQLEDPVEKNADPDEDKNRNDDLNEDLSQHFYSPPVIAATLSKNALFWSVLMPQFTGNV